MSEKKKFDDMSDEEFKQELSRGMEESRKKGEEWLKKPGRKLMMYALGLAIAVALIYFLDNDTLRLIRRIIS